MDEHLAGNIGRVAREARTDSNLTQAQVAEMLGIATEVYGRMERGLMLPSVETLAKLCRALGVSADALLGFDKADADPSVFVAPPLISPRRPEIQRLLNWAERLERRQVRLLTATAREFEKKTEKTGGSRGKDPQK